MALRGKVLLICKFHNFGKFFIIWQLNSVNHTSPKCNGLVKIVYIISITVTANEMTLLNPPTKMSFHA